MHFTRFWMQKYTLIHTHTEEINLALPKNKQTHNRGFIFYDKMKDCNNDERNGDL